MTSVLVCDDSPLAREALRRAVATVPGVERVTTAANGEEVLRRWGADRSDLILMDVRMPGLGGVETVRRLLSADPGARIIMLTVAEDLDGVALAVAAGARGYLHKDASRAELRATVTQALADPTWRLAPRRLRSAELGAAPSISIFEPGFLRTTLALHRAGRVPAGAMVKLYFGGDLQFGLPPTATALAAYLELLEPSGLPWSVAVLGGDVVGCGLAELAIRRGGHVRVGLEDYAGPDVPDDIELLDAAVALVERLRHTPASIAEARAILGIPKR